MCRHPHGWTCIDFSTQVIIEPHENPISDLDEPERRLEEDRDGQRELPLSLWWKARRNHRQVCAPLTLYNLLYSALEKEDRGICCTLSLCHPSAEERPPPPAHFGNRMRGRDQHEDGIVFTKYYRNEVGEMGSIGSEKPAQWEKAEGGGTVGEEERILVSVRLRPLNAKELERNDTSDWECIDRTTVVFKSNLPDRSMHPIAYTFVFGSKCGTRDVYEEGAKEVALSVVKFGSISFDAPHQSNNGYHVELSDKLDKVPDISPRHSISSSMSTGTILQQTRDESFEASSNDFKDHYREVRCIEIHASGTNISEEFNLPFTEESDDLPSQTDLDKLEDTGPQSISHAYLRPETEQPVNSITETIDDFIKTCLDDMSPWPTMPKIMTSRELPLTRSRSCRASLMTTPSSYWTEEAEQHDGRPPTNFLNEFPVSPGWIPRKISVPLNDIKNEAYSFEGSQNSEEPISSHVIEDQSIRIVPEEDITNVSNPFSGMVQMAQSQHQKELTDDQV
ncbi:hypothetical protein GW17_00002839 [Ensete ventricosum]|nr:hypothetical protein GW17_00002839 [Ensete ventricosum]